MSQYQGISESDLAYIYMICFRSPPIKKEFELKCEGNVKVLIKFKSSYKLKFLG
jgi:hypothetical protein